MKSRYLLFAMLLVSALAASLAGFGQTKVFAYDYDASGNRIERQLIQLKSATMAGDNQGQEVFEGTLDKRDIKIYPNPTKGSLQVEIPFSEEQQQVTLQVYNMQGALVSDQLVTNETTVVDLNRQPAGMYILRIFSGQSVSEWKIIKE
jgi:YD repeat-containing protein